MHNNKQILSVTKLNQHARLLLEQNFRQILVEGEISNFSTPTSGHWYFTLKDKNAQVRCAMFRSNNLKVSFQIENGMHIIVKAKVSLYENRGDFQLLVEKLEEVGHGALQRAFDLLKAKLSKEGLFETKHKKNIPKFPKQLGVITSVTGAAIQDVLTVLKRRFPLLPITIYHSSVQGKEAVESIIAAINTASRDKACDVLLLTRGGGSLEDLWSFNEESVARAIFASKIPVVSAIGHEIDFTISDFVADLRAPTPSAAAELIVPDQQEISSLIQSCRKQLEQHIDRQLTNNYYKLKILTNRLQQTHPKQLLLQQIQHLDYTETRLYNTMKHQIVNYNTRHEKLRLMIFQNNPKKTLSQFMQNLIYNTHLLNNIMSNKMEKYQYQLKSAISRLHAISPLATLGRGYAIVSNMDGEVINSIKEINVHSKINTRLIDGTLSCVVKSIKKDL